MASSGAWSAGVLRVARSKEPSGRVAGVGHDQDADRADDISIGEYGRRDVLRLIAARAHATPCDKQGRITLTEELLRHAGIDDEAVLVGVLNKFEIWSRARLAENEQNATQNFAEAAKQLGL